MKFSSSSSLPPSAPSSLLLNCTSLYLSLSPSRYDVELFQRIEQLIGKRLPLYLTVEEEVMALMERVSEAQRHAKMVRYGETVCDKLSGVFHWSSPQELQSSMENSKRKRKFREEDEEEEGEQKKPRTKKRRHN